MSSEPTFRVVIVGGGISGLSTAWYLQQGAQANGLEVEYLVLEQSDRWGGKIRTDHVQDQGKTFVVEAGPDSFLTQKRGAVQLAHDLGLDNELIGVNNEVKQVYVLSQGKFMALPEGLSTGIPTQLMPFARSALVSPWGKLRMGLDLFIGVKPGNGDETVADFIRRRLGGEALEKIAEPLMSGIHSADPERQSLLATFPHLRDLEQKHGSLIRGMRAMGKKQPIVPNGSRGVFAAPQKGMEDLIQQLIPRLSGELRLNTRLKAIRCSPDGGYDLILGENSHWRTDAIVITTPASLAGDLLSGLVPQVTAQLQAIRCVSTITLSMAFHRADIRHPLAGFGLVIPRTERRFINAVGWSSTKFKNRADDDTVLLRVFLGGSRHPEAMDIDDEVLFTKVRNELQDLYEIRVAPIFHRIYRWPSAIPQYDLDHRDRVDHIERSLPNGIYITGSSYHGAGIPDCIQGAQQTVQKVIMYAQTGAKPLVTLTNEISHA